MFLKRKIITSLIIIVAIITLVFINIKEIKGLILVHYLENSGYTCNRQENRTKEEQWNVLGDGCYKRVKYSDSNSEGLKNMEIIYSVNGTIKNPLFHIEVLDDSKHTGRFTQISYSMQELYGAELTCKNVLASPIITNCYDLKQYIQTNDINISKVNIEEVQKMYNIILKLYPEKKITNEILMESKID